MARTAILTTVPSISAMAEPSVTAAVSAPWPAGLRRVSRAAASAVSGFLPVASRVATGDIAAAAGWRVRR